MPQNKKKERSEFIKGLSLLSEIGIRVAACIFIGVLIGRLLDNALGTSPWLILLFSLLGVAAAFKSLSDFTKKI